MLCAIRNAAWSLATIQDRETVTGRKGLPKTHRTRSQRIASPSASPPRYPARGRGSAVMSKAAEKARGHVVDRAIEAAVRSCAPGLSGKNDPCERSKIRSRASASSSLDARPSACRSASSTVSRSRRSFRCAQMSRQQPQANRRHLRLPTLVRVTLPTCGKAHIMPCEFFRSVSQSASFIRVSRWSLTDRILPSAEGLILNWPILTRDKVPGKPSLPCCSITQTITSSPAESPGRQR
jgi:hypothetical protein